MYAAFVVTTELVDVWTKEVNDDPLLSLKLYGIRPTAFQFEPMFGMVGQKFELVQGWAILRIQVRQGLRVMAEGQLLYNPTTDMTIVIPGKGRSDALLAISLVDNQEVDYRPNEMIPEDYYAL